MDFMDTQDLYDLADDTVNYTLTDRGALEGYLVFLWQELERLDPEKWGANLRIELADCKHQHD